jgi:SAM-dependent methyltransferase
VTQNIYDDERFFEAYARLPRSVQGLDAAPEWPALQALLPALEGRRVLDLGCGFGRFGRWARKRGAARVLGIDVSGRMLARARAETHDPAIAYLRADLEHLDVPAGTFDLVYSALALHYVEDLAGLLVRVHAALAPAGALVFSVEHPLCTAPASPGWSVDAAGRSTWPVAGYLDEGPRVTDWLAPGVIKQHRTIGTYVNLLIRSGFAIAHLAEWGPSEEQVASHPEWANERQRAPFLLVSCRPG